jgi:hypothetical protein
MEKLRDFLSKASKSRMMWVNAFLAVLGGLELFGTHLTTLFGAQVSAAILLLGGMTNLVLRSVTTQALSEK